MKYNIITILGPTATGKTKLGVKLADNFNGEIISADSRQVYKWMDIGTGKDLEEYGIGSRKIPYHLINIIEPTEEFNLYLFKEKFIEAFNNISSKMKTPFLIGGTGLYLNSVLKNYKLRKADFSEKEIKELNEQSKEELQDILLRLNPDVHNTTDLLRKDRIIKAIIVAKSEEIDLESIQVYSLNIGVKLPREEIKKRITERLKKRLEEGMISEVENLIDNGIDFDKLNYFGLEYRYIGDYLKGKINYNDMYQKLNSAIHNFAKRQMTWFRKMEKEGIKIHWIDGSDFEAAKKIIDEKYFN